MKKVLTLCLCTMIIAASAFADFKRDAEFETMMNSKTQNANTLIKPDQIAQQRDDARSVALENALAPLYEQILERKANGDAAEELWAKVRAIRVSMGFASSSTRSYSDVLDTDGETCYGSMDLGSVLGVNVTSFSTLGLLNDFGPITSLPSCWQGALVGGIVAAGPDTSYLWTAPFTGSFTFSTCNDYTDYDSGIQLYSCSDTDVPTFLCGNDDACDLNAKVECYPLEAGQQVMIVIDGWQAASEGAFQLDISCCFQCPPNAIRSPEPDCSPNYVDFFNYGCPVPGTTLPPAFEPIECNSTICATSGFWEDAAGNIYNDQDWYVLNLTAQTQVRLCVASDVFFELAVYSGACPNPVYIDGVQYRGEGCTPRCFTLCLDAGVYYIQAFLYAPCGTPYAISVDCSPCDDCHADDPIFVDVSGGLPHCECITLPCANTVYYFCVGPLGPNEFPISATVTPGCFSADPTGIPGTRCDEECTPTQPIGIADWYYNQATSTWCIPIGAIEAGCFCFCLDDVLPVELNEFNAVAGDGEIALNWSTASESDNDHFEIMRDGSQVGSVTATNSATGNSYRWTEENLSNGRSYSYDLVSVSLNGTRETIATASATPTASAATISEYALHQNYPNPFNPETSISFDVAEAGLVTVTVYNTVGQTVATLVNGALEVGRHNVTFDAANLPSGLYFYRMDAGQFSAVKKMILMK